MAHYVYRCPVCGQEKEVDHSIKETPEILCPERHKAPARVKMTRVIFAPSVQFKGSGFYATDYAGK